METGRSISSSWRSVANAFSGSESDAMLRSGVDESLRVSFMKSHLKDGWSLRSPQ